MSEEMDFPIELYYSEDKYGHEIVQGFYSFEEAFEYLEETINNHIVSGTSFESITVKVKEVSEDE